MAQMLMGRLVSHILADGKFSIGSSDEFVAMNVISPGLSRRLNAIPLYKVRIASSLA